MICFLIAVKPTEPYFYLSSIFSTEWLISLSTSIFKGFIGLLDQPHFREESPDSSANYLFPSATVYQHVSIIVPNG